MSWVLGPVLLLLLVVVVVLRTACTSPVGAAFADGFLMLWNGWQSPRWWVGNSLGHGFEIGSVAPLG